jgi:dCTP deaminase
MSTIVDHQILHYVKTHGMIEPYNESQLNPASYDVCVGPKILIEGHAFGPESNRKRWHEVDITEKVYMMKPHEFILASTKEYVNIPTYLESIFQLKSSRGREGYEHAMAGYIDPGFSGNITLELYNLNRRHSIPLFYGMLIGQLRFLTLNTTPYRSYAETGHYNGDTGVQPSKANLKIQENISIPAD